MEWKRNCKQNGSILLKNFTIVDLFCRYKGDNNKNIAYIYQSLAMIPSKLNW